MMEDVSTNNVILCARGITKSYVKGETVVKVLHGIDLDVHKGEILLIVGPSGSGKSTLLHIMGLLDSLDGGSLTVFNRETASMSLKEKCRIRNRRIGFVFQMHHMLQELTIIENVMVPALIKSSVIGYLANFARHKRHAMALLTTFGLSHRAHHFPNEVSGGELQRAAIARSLTNDPEIVLCDEPTGNLDSENAHVVLELIKKVNRETGKTFVIVTHDPRLEGVGHRTIHLLDGKIQA